jgi:integrase
MKQWSKIKGIEGLYRNANGKYYARFTKPRKTFRSLGTDKLKLARERIKELKISESSQPEQKAQAKCQSLGDLVECYKESELPRAKVSTRTKLRIKQALNALKRSKALWNADFKSLSPKVIHKEVDNINHLSNSSKNYSLYAIKRVMDFAEEKCLIPKNDFVRMKSFSVSPRKLELPSDKQFEQLVHFLRYPEERKYEKVGLPDNWEDMKTSAIAEKMKVSLSTAKRRIAEARGKTYYLKVGRPEVAYAFLFLCYTGLRLGEARKLSWEDVLDDRIIIRGTKTTSAFRFLPIYPNLANLLESMKEHRGAFNLEDKVLGRQRIDKALRRACDRVGVPYLRHHDLRHYFATKAVQSGVDMPTIAKWLGHADGGVLAMKVYSNVMDEHSINQSAKLQFGRLHCYRTEKKI